MLLTMRKPSRWRSELVLRDGAAEPAATFTPSREGGASVVLRSGERWHVTSDHGVLAVAFRVLTEDGQQLGSFDYTAHGLSATTNAGQLRVVLGGLLKPYVRLVDSSGGTVLTLTDKPGTHGVRFRLSVEEPAPQEPQLLLLAVLATQAMLSRQKRVRRSVGAPAGC